MIKPAISQQPTPATALFRPGLIIALVSFAVYLNTLSYDFVYDDVSQVLKNPWITDLRHIPDMFTKSVWSFLAVPSVSNHYRPLMHVIYMVNFHIFGLKPWGFHLVNVLFHAGNSVLVFILASRLLDGAAGSVQRSALSSHNSLQPPLNLRGGAEGGGVAFTIHDSRTVSRSPLGRGEGVGFSIHDSRLFAFLAGLLFAVHPIHTEAVAWVGAVTDLSFTFFYLLSLNFWIQFDKDQGKHVYIYSLLSFSLALLCKEPAATLLLALLAYDISMGKSGRRLVDHVRVYFPYVVVLGIYLAARSYALGGFAPVGAYRKFTTEQLVINVFPLFTRYLELMILPVRLNAFHILQPVSSLFGVKGMLSFAVFSVYAVLTVIAYRKNRPAFFGLMLIVIPLLPVFYIPGLGEATLAERYLYLPSAGFILLLIITFSWISKKLPRYSAAVVLMAFALAGMYSLQSVMRNPVWKDNLTLFSDMVRKSPDGELPRGMLGNALMDQGKLDEAIEQYRIIINELNPNSAQAHRNLGLAFAQKGMKKEAVEEYEKAVAIAPADFEARRGLVLAYEEAGLLDNAIREYRTLLELTPKSAETHYRLGVALAKKGMTAEAVSHYKEAVALNPNYAEAHYNLGSIYANSGRIDEAVGHFEAAVRLKTDNAFYRNILGITYGQKGLMDKAVEQFEAAVRLAPQESAYLDNLRRAKGMKSRR